MSIDSEPDSIDPMQASVIAKLDAEQISAIDVALLQAVSDRWQKVAYVVGSVMAELPAGVPDIFYAQRIADMQRRGHIELRGDPNRMRYCEVRRAGYDEI